MIKSCFKLTKFICCISVLGIISGCAILSDLKPCRITIDYAPDADSKTIWPDADFQNEFCKYWTLRYDGNIEKTYAMEAPQFREQVTMMQYESYVKRTKDNALQKISINGSEKDGDNKTYFDCNFHLKTQSEKDILTYIRDNWILIDGDWFHALRDPLFFPIEY